MRKLTLAIAVAAGFAAIPVLACPMHQAAQTTGSTATASPMMCAAPTAAAQAQHPGQATQPALPGQSMAGGCPCCRNMAMMPPQPRQPSAMQDMPGMQEMPQGAPTNPPPTAPETPRPN
jgi:hypothetical protein